ncbi:MAG: PA2779 family protein [Nitrospirae bacterium]|nr:PA2779 family protein [Nitrospirota bacterium]
MAKKLGILLGRSITFYLVAAMLLIASIPSQSAAMFISSDVVSTAAVSPVVDSASDIAKVSTFLESKIVKQRLADFGLTSEEISSRLSRMSADQLHQIASHIDQVDSGGDSALGIIMALLVIAILVIIVMKLMGREIIIK